MDKILNRDFAQKAVCIIDIWKMLIIITYKGVWHETVMVAYACNTSTQEAGWGRRIIARPAWTRRKILFQKDKDTNKNLSRYVTLHLFIWLKLRRLVVPGVGKCWQEQESVTSWKNSWSIGMMLSTNAGWFLPVQHLCIYPEKWIHVSKKTYIRILPAFSLWNSPKLEETYQQVSDGQAGTASMTWECKGVNYLPAAV